MTKVLSIWPCSQGCGTLGNLSEQLQESLYLQTETARFDFRDCLYTRLLSLGHAIVKDKNSTLMFT